MRSDRTSVHTATRSLVTFMVCGVFLAPLLFMLVGSLRLPGLPPPDGWEWLPDPVHWGNYGLALRAVPEWSAALRNSVIVVALAVPVTVLVASGAGFVIATSAGFKRRFLIFVSVVALVVPTSLLWVPRFTVFRMLGMTDSLGALVAPALYGTSPVYALLFALTYSRIPATIFDSARVEGSSPLRTWWRVAVPLGRPTMFAVAMLSFAFHWSNVVDPVLYVSSPNHLTLPLALARLQSFEPTNFPLLLAGAVMVTAPAVGFFLVAQRAFLTRSITGGPTP